jgi:hypothetical protein
MKYLGLYCWLGCSLLAVSSLQAQEEETPLDPRLVWEMTETRWEQVDEYEGRFRVNTPGAFREMTDTVRTALGEMVQHTYFFRPNSEKAENEVYMITYLDYPPGSLHHDSTELLQEFFAETLAGAEENVRGEVMFVREESQQGFPARYWRIDYLNGRASIRTKAGVVANRFYMVQTVTRRSYGMNHSTDRFIDSFRVYPPGEEQSAGF